MPKRKQFSRLSRCQKFRRIQAQLVEVNETDSDSSLDFLHSEVYPHGDDLQSKNIASFDSDDLLCCSKQVTESSLNLSTSSDVDSILSVNCSSTSEEDAGELSINISTPEKDVKFIPGNIECYNQQLKDTLHSWAVSEKSIPHEGITRLLKKLNEKGFKVPNSARGLLKYKPIKLEEMGKGEYYHFSAWPQSCVKIIESHGSEIQNINAIVNIDGIPLYSDSRKYEAYPILLKIKE